MIDKKLIEKYDRSRVLPFLRAFPEQCKDAISLGNKLNLKERGIEKIVCCGMGGSGVGGAIIKNLFKDELKVPFDSFNSYALPSYVDEKTLVLAVSYSGNTEETLACYKQAVKKKALVIAISSNGKLRKIAKYCIAVPDIFPQPRIAIAYTTLPMIPVLSKLSVIGEKTEELNNVVSFLKKEAEVINNKAQKLATSIHGKFPVIYGTDNISAVTYRWRTELNENSKTFALNHVIPEENHNEINAFLGLGNAYFLFLRADGETERINKRIEFTKKVFGKMFPVSDVFIKGKTLLEKTFYAIYLAALTSYYLALLNGVDPEKISVINSLKRELEK